MILGLTIQHNAVVECVSKHSPGIQMSLSPCVDRAWNDVATKSVSRYRPVDVVIIQQSLADEKKIVIAVRPICATRTAAKQNDGVRMQSFHKALHRFRESAILYGPVSHLRLYIGRDPKSK